MEDGPSMLMWSVAQEKTNLSIQNLSIFSSVVGGKRLDILFCVEIRGHSVCVRVCVCVRLCAAAPLQTDLID